MNYCSVAACIHCYLLLMAAMVMCHMSICHMAAGNVNQLLLCGFTIDMVTRNMSYVNMPYGGGKRLYVYTVICICC